MSQAAGIIFVTPSNEALFLKRSDKGDHPGEWCFPAGGVEDGEEPEDAARREAIEETGFKPNGIAPLDRRTSTDGVDFSTFIQRVDEPFLPKINDEHVAYAWAPIDYAPEPLHPGVKDLIASLATDEAPFNESDHPRDPAGKFGSGGAGAGEKKRNPVKMAAEHVTQAREWLKGKSAGDVLTAVASNHKLQTAAKEGLVFGIMSIIAHGSQMHGSFQDQHVEDFVSHAVHNFSTVAAVSVLQAKDVMRSAVKALIGARSMAKDDAENEDGVLLVLQQVLEMLGDDNEEPKAQDSALAFDRDSVRSYDRDGRMHVAVTNISKATVNPYLGREIPDWETLGLDPDKVYKLFRDPEEIAKAAPTFNNIPLLSRHVAVTVDDHQPDLVIGSTGTDAEFNSPFLRNSLVVWAKSGIDDIESDAKKELSSAYRYIADMTPGTFDGVEFDGVMRDIVGNHVALVKEGRAGADVVVGDSNEELLMSKTILTRKAAVAHGALLVFLKPKLAQDAKIDLNAILASVTSKNFNSKKPDIVAGLKKQLDGKLAKDANLDDVVGLLDQLDKVDAPDVIEAAVDPAATDPNSALPAKPDDKALDDENAELRAFLASKGLSEEDIAAACGMTGGAPKAMDAEETDEEKKKREAKEAAEKKDGPPFAKDKDGPAMKPDTVTKKAMDEAIKSAEKRATDGAIKTQREIRDAERAVRPYVGDLAMAHDSAEAVYRTALGALGIKIDGIHASAFPAILGMQPLPSAGKKPSVAMDAASAKSFSEFYPDAGRIAIR